MSDEQLIIGGSISVNYFKSPNLSAASFLIRLRKASVDCNKSLNKGGQSCSGNG